ncbi:MAG: hypothetical protein ACI9KM_001352 [Rubritalea sp.]|jgi:hypothetical protein
MPPYAQELARKWYRLQVKPNTCSRDDGWDDCTNDRSRVEFCDGKGVKSGNTVTYEYSMFIPKTTDLKQNGSPTIFLGQLNTTAGQHYSSPVMVAWAGPSRGITFRTYDSFNWNISKITLVTDVIPASEQVGNWIDVKYEIAVYADERRGE